MTWLSFAPSGGSVAAGETDTVQVTFDATALTEGDYNANINISSNDTSDPLEVVPAALHVTGDPVDPDQSTVDASDNAVVCPAGDGPIGLVRDGDRVVIDPTERILDIDVAADELERRRADWSPPRPRFETGAMAKYAKLVGSASRGAVCD